MGKIKVKAEQKLIKSKVLYNKIKSDAGVIPWFEVIIPGFRYSLPIKFVILGGGAALPAALPANLN